MRQLLHGCPPCLAYGSFLSILLRSATRYSTSATRRPHEHHSGGKHTDKIAGQRDHGTGSKRRSTALEDILWGISTPFEPLSRFDPKPKAAVDDKSMANIDTKQTIDRAEHVSDQSQAYMKLAESQIATIDVPVVSNSARVGREDPIGRSMPSSVMRRLNMKFHADIKQRRRRHGLRIRILAALSELRHLVQVGAAEKRDSRVYVYLSDLNRYYIEYLYEHAELLSLRSSTCIAMERHRSHGKVPVTIAVADATHPQLIPRATPYTSDNPYCPLFDKEMYARRFVLQEMAERAHAVRPDVASWVDYLVKDLGEPTAHALFLVVAQSKVPERTSSRLRTAVEEALVLAFNRCSFTLSALESLRVCEYYLRQKTQPVQSKQLLRAWQAAGETIAIDLAVSQNADLLAGTDPSSSGISQATTVAELAFKRWNDIVSMMLVRLCRESTHSNILAAWALVHRWFLLWVPVMQMLCPVRRRNFADGSDPHAWAYWRPKLPGRDRLHTLTLSSEAVTRLMSVLVYRGHTLRAAQFLGFAISEIGVPASMSMFNVMLRGCVNPGTQCHDNLPDLSSLPLLNTQSVSLYVDETRLLAEHQPDSASFRLLLRGMQRWSLTPDAFTLGVLIINACRANDLPKLQSVLRLFATQWGVLPKESSWRDMKQYGMHHEAYRVLEKFLGSEKGFDK